MAPSVGCPASSARRAEGQKLPRRLSICRRRHRSGAGVQLTGVCHGRSSRPEQLKNVAERPGSVSSMVRRVVPVLMSSRLASLAGCGSVFLSGPDAFDNVAARSRRVFFSLGNEAARPRPGCWPAWSVPDPLAVALHGQEWYVLQRVVEGVAMYKPVTLGGGIAMVGNAGRGRPGWETTVLLRVNQRLGFAGVVFLGVRSPPVVPRCFRNSTSSLNSNGLRRTRVRERHQLASMMFSLTPTVPQTASWSRDSITTRPRAAVAAFEFTTRTL